MNTPESPSSPVSFPQTTGNWGRRVLLQEDSHLEKENHWVRKVILEDPTRSFPKSFEMKEKMSLWFWAREKSHELQARSS